MQAPSRAPTRRGVPLHHVKVRKDWLDAEWNRLKRFLWQRTSMWITVWRKHTVSSTTTRGLLFSRPRCHGQQLRLSAEIPATHSPQTHTHKMCQNPDLKQVSLSRYDYRPESYWKRTKWQCPVFFVGVSLYVQSSFIKQDCSSVCLFFSLQAIIAINPQQNGTQWQPKDWMIVVFYECYLVSFVYTDGQWSVEN